MRIGKETGGELDVAGGERVSEWLPGPSQGRRRSGDFADHDQARGLPPAGNA
jgi:hypothetical protein